MTHHNNAPLLNNINIYERGLQDWGSFKNHVCSMQIFSFVITTRYKLNASTVVNQRNRNKEWRKISQHGLKHEYRDRKWFAFCNSPLPNFKSSLKSRLQILETLKISWFLKTTELNIDALSVPQTWCRPTAFNYGFSNRNRPISIEIWMLTKLTAVSPAPANNMRGYAF